MQPNPKQLILALLQAAEGEPLSARQAISAGELFGLSANNVRVTLARLASAGLIEGAGRGSYQLASQSAAFAGELAGWRESEARLSSWHGDWIGVHVGHLGRTDRRQLRIRERALNLSGFRELQRGLLIRPNNLLGGAKSAHARLLATGLDSQAAVFNLTQLPSAQEQQARQLWDGAALQAGYHAMAERLHNWLARSAQLEPATAAREAFLLGNQAIHLLVFDPLLPEPLIDIHSRQVFIRNLLAFEQQGRSIWQRWPEAQPQHNE